MSSTTDRQRQAGQVLPMLAMGIVGILAIAALVFDVGHSIFERRRLQDAADAGALAGARFINDAACAPGAATRMTNACPAYRAAVDLLTDTTLYGFAASQVKVQIPPSGNTLFPNLTGHLEVSIDTRNGSIFAGLLGIPEWRVAATAVAANVQSYSLPYAMLSLNETHCGAGQIGGNGTVSVNALIMVSSTCSTSGALQFNGNNVQVTAAGCATAGTSSQNGSPINVDCTGPVLEGQTPIKDPLRSLSGPAVQPTPAAPVIVGSGSNNPPNGCPGSTTPSTAANPTGCDINFNRDKVVRLYPGTYYGGLRLRETSHQLTVYLEPGIYYLAGGGLEISGDITVRTVDGPILGLPQTTLGGGVFIYNTDASTCATAGGKACLKAVDFATGTGSDVDLLPYEDDPYDGLLLYQDRNASSQPAMSIAGNAAMTISGTVYLPKADFNYSGNGAGEVLSAQVICDEFAVSGNGGLTVTYDPEDVLKLRDVGLVQ